MKPFAIALSFLSITASSLAFEPEEDGMYAVFDTTMGEFTIRLAYDGVPLTTANFVGLAEGTIPRFSAETGEPVSTGPYYDGLIFHRVIDQFVIQSGDPLPDDSDINGPGYRIPDEIHPSLSHNIPYVIAMANSYCFECEEARQFWDIGENTGGSQFYITIQPPEGTGGPTDLDGHYAIFGVLVDGEEIVEAIGDVALDPTKGYRPLEDVIINTVKILRVGEEANAWDPSDYGLPGQKTTNVPVQLAKTANGSAFQFPSDAGQDFIVHKSTDLETWTDEILKGDDSQAETLAVEIGNAEKLFIQLSSVLPPSSFQERIPNAVFSMSMSLHPLGSNTWTFNFNDNVDDFDDENGFGTVVLPGYPDAGLQGYEYHRLPNGARLRVVTESRQVMTFYLRYTDGNKGGYIAWVDDYLNGTGNSPLRFPSTGTFELTLP